jgi:hypothetical protein
VGIFDDDGGWIRGRGIIIGYFASFSIIGGGPKGLPRVYYLFRGYKSRAGSSFNNNDKLLGRCYLSPIDFLFVPFSRYTHWIGIKPNGYWCQAWWIFKTKILVDCETPTTTKAAVSLRRIASLCVSVPPISITVASGRIIVTEVLAMQRRVMSEYLSWALSSNEMSCRQRETNNILMVDK